MSYGYDDREIRIIVETLLKDEEKLKELKKDLGDIGVSGKDAGAGMKSFGGDMMGVIAKVGPAVGILGGVAAGLKKTYEMGKRGADLKFAEQKFDNLTAAIGRTSDAVLNEMSDVTGGILADSKLIQSALDSLSLGLVDNADDAIRLTKVIGALNMDTNQLTLALTNQTTARFDQLNMSVDGFEERLKSLEEQGLDTTAAFTEAFLQQAEAQVERVGDVVDAELATFMQAEASYQNTMDNVDKFFSGFWAREIQAWDMVIHRGEILQGMFDQQAGVIENTSESYDDYLARMFEAANITEILSDHHYKRIIAGKASQYDLEVYTELVGALTEWEWKFNKSVEANIEDSVMWSGALEYQTTKTEDLAEATEEAGEEAETAAEAYDRLFGAVNQDYDFAGAGKDLAYQQAGAGRLAEFEEQQKDINILLAESGDLAYQVYEEQYTDAMNQATLAQMKLAVEMGDMTAPEAAKKAYNELGLDYGYVFGIMQDDTKGWSQLLTGAIGKLDVLQLKMLGIDGLSADLYVNIHTSGGIPGWASKRAGVDAAFGGSANVTVDPKDNMTLTQSFEAEGGFYNPEDFVTVGERGAELMYRGYIFPHEASKHIIQAFGLNPKGFAMGGAYQPGDTWNPSAAGTWTTTETSGSTHDKVNVDPSWSPFAINMMTTPASDSEAAQTFEAIAQEAAAQTFEASQSSTQAAINQAVQETVEKMVGQIAATSGNEIAELKRITKEIQKQTGQIVNGFKTAQLEVNAQ